MDSGDEDEENQEEPEVKAFNIVQLCNVQPCIYLTLLLLVFDVIQEKSKSTKGKRGPKIAKLGTFKLLCFVLFFPPEMFRC